MTQFLSLDSDDATNTKTLLYESIPLTGTVVSGTYSDENIKLHTRDVSECIRLPLSEFLCEPYF